MSKRSIVLVLSTGFALAIGLTRNADAMERDFAINRALLRMESRNELIQIEGQLACENRDASARAQQDCAQVSIRESGTGRNYNLGKSAAAQAFLSQGTRNVRIVGRLTDNDRTVVIDRITGI